MKLRVANYQGTIGLAVAWLVIFGLIYLWVGAGFISPRNFETLARQSAIVSMAAIGMTFIIVAGGIDLSVGSTVAFVSVTVAAVLARGGNPVVAIAVGMFAGLAVGLCNGALITKLKVTPFIVTLGSLLVVRGIAKGMANEQKIDAPSTWIKELLATLPLNQKWMLVPAGVWLTLLAAVIMAFVLKRTKFGRYVVAVGSNERAAMYSGIAIDRVKLMVYGLGGVFAGLAGVLMFSRLTVGDPTVAIGLELDVIAAVVIGGASLSGGSGTIVGTLLGALIMATIRAGCSQMGLDNWIQEIVTGGIIVAAVALDRLRNRSGGNA